MVKFVHLNQDLISITFKHSDPHHLGPCRCFTTLWQLKFVYCHKTILNYISFCFVFLCKDLHFNLPLSVLWSVSHWKSLNSLYQSQNIKGCFYFGGWNDPAGRFPDMRWDMCASISSPRGAIGTVQLMEQHTVTACTCTAEWTWISDNIGAEPVNTEPMREAVSSSYILHIFIYRYCVWPACKFYLHTHTCNQIQHYSGFMNYPS